MKMPQTNNDLIKLNLSELINNPTGKNSAYLSNRKLIKENLQMKYQRLIRKHKKFEYKIYKNNDSYIFHFKVPSETYDKLFYDVVIEFYCEPEEPEVKNDRNINRYYLNIFSNSPAFTFTYTYVCNKNNMIPLDCKSFCFKESLTSAPQLRNPVEIYGFEKSIYFACLYIINNNLYIKFNIEKDIFLFNKKKFDNTIKTQEGKLNEYNLLKSKTVKEKKLIKKRKTEEVNKILMKRNTKKRTKKSTRPTRPKRK